MRPDGRSVAGALLLGIVFVAGRVWYHNTHSGTFWDDARDGECIDAPTFGALQQMRSGGYPRTPVVDCSGPNANYVIVAHTTDTKIQCPDGDKDAWMTARIKIESDNGRRTSTTSGFGLMCAAPMLHVGRCYSPPHDRGLQVSPTMDCNPWSWQVTRRIDGATDIHRCNPATGLVLTTPQVTYCETVAPLPPELKNNAVLNKIDFPPPPAG